LRSDEPHASIVTMNQADLGLNLSTERTCKREFLAEMQTVVPWADFPELIAPHAPEGKEGRPPFALESTLRMHFVRQCFNLSDPAMEEALHDVPLFGKFANLGWDARLPDESTILRFGKTPSPRHLFERHELAEQIVGTVNDLLQAKGLLRKAGTVVDATLIAAPSSTENAARDRDPEKNPTKKGRQWYFGMKAPIGVDAGSGLVHTARGTAANVNDVVEGNSLLHGDETVVFADAGQGGASVSGPQAPIRPHQGALARAEEEHRATDHVVCAVQPVHGAQKTAGIGWTSPSKAGPCSVRGRKCGANWTNTRHSGRHTLRNLLYC
jgi:IS5 family transposase